MYKSYIKKVPLKAIRFKDDFETYKFICKELNILNVADTEKEYHNIKKFGINLNSKESRQVLFIGDYLANAGNGDFYVVRKDFMEENYNLIEDEKPNPGIEKVVCGISDDNIAKIPVSEKTNKEVHVGIDTEDESPYSAVNMQYSRRATSKPGEAIAFGGGCFVDRCLNIDEPLPMALRQFSKANVVENKLEEYKFGTISMKGDISFPKELKPSIMRETIELWTKPTTPIKTKTVKMQVTNSSITASHINGVNGLEFSIPGGKLNLHDIEESKIPDEISTKGLTVDNVRLLASVAHLSETYNFLIFFGLNNEDTLEIYSKNGLESHMTISYKIFKDLVKIIKK